MTPEELFYSPNADCPDSVAHSPALIHNREMCSTSLLLPSQPAGKQVRKQPTVASMTLWYEASCTFLPGPVHCRLAAGWCWHMVWRITIHKVQFLPPSVQ